MNEIKRNLIPTMLATVLSTSFIYVYMPKLFILMLGVNFLLCNLFFYICSFSHQSRKKVTIYYSLTALVVCCITWLSFSMYEGGTLFTVMDILIFGKNADAYGFFSIMVENLVISFMLSTFIFYFTNTIYRSSMLFLICIIPCSIFARQIRIIPLILLVLIISLFIASIVHCKQTFSYSQKRAKVILSKAYGKTMLLFMVFSALLVSAIPAPNKTVFSLERYMWNNHRFGVAGNNNYYRKSSVGRTFYNPSMDRVIMTVDADEPLYLKFQVYDEFIRISGKEAWVKTDITHYSNWYANWREEVFCNEYSTFLKIIGDIMKNDEFKDKYKFDVPDMGTRVGESATATVKYADYTKLSGYVSPINTYDLKSEYESYKKMSGEISPGGRYSFLPTKSYTLHYYPESNYNKKVMDFASNFNMESYKQFLNDAQKYAGDKEATLIDGRLSDLEYAQEYYNSVFSLKIPSIERLTEKITEGCESDIEKALAIKNYFEKNDFVYDLDYMPPKDNDNIEYFLFESKTGICIDYASACTLMARYAGLPARYVEGYVAREMDDGTYVVKIKNGHAYTEIYIAGIGWMIVDATMSADAGNDRAAYILTAIEVLISRITSKHIISALVIFCILFFTYQYILPFLREAIFRLRLKKSEPADKVIRVYEHIRELLDNELGGNHKNLTGDEIKSVLYKKYKIDIEGITKAVEKSVYAKVHITEDEADAAYLLYKSVYNTLKKANGVCVEKSEANREEKMGI